MKSTKLLPALSHTVYFKAKCVCKPIAMGASNNYPALTVAFSRFDFGSSLYPLTGINGAVRFSNLKSNFKQYAVMGLQVDFMPVMGTCAIGSI